MDHNKKRRSSILKKKLNDEDTTTEIKARRISFSGKKSVKEFIAGDEAATIWGTSYEESAEDLQQAQSTERSLVNVNEKRIVLRNRRVVMDSKQQPKRRSNVKKKTIIAENDKENVFVEPPKVEVLSEAKPPTEIQTEAKSESPAKTELALVKSQFDVSKSVDMSKPIERTSIWSNTFDFINYSGPVNKTVSIEQSLDLTLNDFELQMYRFRVPVRATDVSPNISLNRKDGSSPNIFGTSMLMSEEDVQMLKIVRGQQAIMNVQATHLTESEVEEINQKTLERKSGGEAVSRLFTNQSMEISMKIPETKSSKRKSETVTRSIVMDSTTIDTNSPMRKKPMHWNDSMNVSNTNAQGSSQNELIGRPTICFESAPIEESIFYTTADIQLDCNDAVEQSISKYSCQTIHFNSKSIIEESSFKNCEDVSATKNLNISMELSLCGHYENPSNAIENAIKTDSNRRTIRYGQGGENIECYQTLKAPIAIYEDSPKVESDSKALLRNRQTIFDSVDMVEEASIHPKLSTLDSKNIKDQNSVRNIAKPEENRRTILYADGGQKMECTLTSSDDITRLQKTLKTPLEVYEDTPKNVESDSKALFRNRQTIFDSVDMEEEASIHSKQSTLDSKSITEQNSVRGPNIVNIKKPEQKRRPILTADGGQKMECALASSVDGAKPLEVYEDTPQVESDSKSLLRNRRTIYDSVDMEDASIHTKQSIPHPKNNKQQNSICGAPIGDIEKEGKINRRTILYAEGGQNMECMLASSSDRTKLQKTLNIPLEDSEKAESNSKELLRRNRQTIYDSADIVEETSGPPATNNKQRQSICTPSDMLEDSPEVVSSMQSAESQQKLGSKKRQSVFIPQDIDVDSPIRASVSIEVTPNTAMANSKDLKPTTSKKSFQQRQSVYTPFDILEDTLQTENRNTFKQKSVYVPSDIVLDDLDSTKDLKGIKQESQQGRKVVLKGLEPSQSTTKKAPDSIEQCVTSKDNQRKSIHAPVDIIEDSPPPRKPLQPKIKIFQTNFTSETKHNPTHQVEVNKRQSVHIPVDMIEDSPEAAKQTQKIVLQRQLVPTSSGIHTDSVIVEDNPALNDRKDVVKESQISFPPNSIQENKYQHQSDNEGVDNMSTLPTETAKTKKPEHYTSEMGATETMLRRPGDLLFRKPLKLVTSDEKKPIPHSSTRTLQEQIMEEMGFSVDFLPKRSTKPTHPKPEPSQKAIYFHEEFDMDASLKPQKPAENPIQNAYSINLSIDDTIHEGANKSKCQTMNSNEEHKTEHTTNSMPTDRKSIYLPQDIECEESRIEKLNSSKTMDESKMEFSIIEEMDTNNQKIVESNMSESGNNQLKQSLRQQKTQSNDLTLNDGKQSRSIRKSIYPNEDLDIENLDDPKSTQIENNNPSGQEKNQVMDNLKEKSMTKSFIMPNRKTVYHDQNVDMEEDLDLESAPKQVPTQSSQTHCRKTNYLHADLEVEDHQKTGQHFNPKIQNSNDADKILSRDSKTPRRQTIYFDQDLEIEENENQQPRVSTKTKRNENLPVERSLLNSQLLSSKVSFSNKFANHNKQTEEDLIIAKPARGTIYFNQDLVNDDPISDGLQMSKTNEQSQKLISSNSQPAVRKTILFNQDIGVEGHTQDNPQTKSSSITRPYLESFDQNQRKSEASKRAGRQTIYFNQDLDVEDDCDQSNRLLKLNANDEMVGLQENVPKRRTVCVNQELDITYIEHEESRASNRQPSQKSNRQTLYFNNDLEEESTEGCPIESFQPSARQFNPVKDEKVDLLKTGTIPKRQTLLLNQDLDITDFEQEQEYVPQGSRELKNVQKSGRHTVYLNHDLEEEKTEVGPAMSFQPLATQNNDKNIVADNLKRQTILGHKDLDISDIDQEEEPKSQVSKVCSRSLQNAQNANRQTLFFNHDLEEEETESRSVKNIQSSTREAISVNDKRDSKRQTIFLNQDLDITDIEHEQHLLPTTSQTSTRSLQNVQKADQQTPYFNQDPGKKNTESRPVKSFTSSARQLSADYVDLQKTDDVANQRKTIFLNQDLDITSIEQQMESEPQNPEVLSRPKQNVQKINRQNLCFKHDLEEEKGGCFQRVLVDDEKIKLPKIGGNPTRETIFLNQDLDMTDIDNAHEHGSQAPNQTLPRPNRQTLFFNHDLEEEESEGCRVKNFQQSGKQPVPCDDVKSTVPIADSVPKRQTIFPNKDLDISDVQQKGDSELQKGQKANRPTLFFNQNLEEEESEAYPDKSIQPPARQPVTVTEKKVDLPKTSFIPKHQTVFLNQDLDITDIEHEQQSEPQVLKEASRSLQNVQKINRQTLYCNQDLEEEQIYRVKSCQQSSRQPVRVEDEKDYFSKPSAIPKRQTIFHNQDLDITDIEHQSASQAFQGPSMSLQRPNRQTLFFNNDLEEDEPRSFQQSSRQPVSSGNEKKTGSIPNRQTIFLNQDLEMSDIEDEQQPTLHESRESWASLAKTQILEEDKKLEAREQQMASHFFTTSKNACGEDRSRQETKIQIQDKESRHQIQQQMQDISKRRTVFLNQDIELDEDVAPTTAAKENKPTLVKKSELSPKTKENRNTMYFVNGKENLEETVQPTRDETTTVKGLRKPKRFTTYDEQPLDIEESPPRVDIVRKSSFSRNLNFDAIQTSQNCTEKSHQGLTARPKVSWKATASDDESPIYNPKLRPKCLGTPGEVDRSLAEYLKAEAAAMRSISQEKSSEGEEEEVFYDAEDGRGEGLKLHDPVNMFEESGMQPLQMHDPKRQTTYSPKKMSEEASDDENGTKQKETAVVYHESRLEGPETRMPLESPKKPNTFNSNVLRTKQDPLDRINNETSHQTGTIPSEVHLRAKQSANQHLKSITTSQKPPAITDEQENFMEISMLPEPDKKPLSPKQTFHRKTIYFPNENAVDASFFDDNNSSKAIHQKHRKTLFFDDALDPKDKMDVSPQKWNKPSSAVQSLGEILQENARLFQQPNLLKPSLDPKDKMDDVSPQKWNKPSSAVQSLNEILQENAKLFKQSNLLKPSLLDEKRSTIFFANTDNSMEVSSTDYHPTDPECTPTKNKSRIPQLIGSAKKLQSMKESINFFQQELPNLGFHSKRDDNLEMECVSPKEQETPRRMSMSVPKKLQESFKQIEYSKQESPYKPRQLEESFETIEIPRKAFASTSRKTKESPKRVDTPRKEVKQLHDSSVAVDDDPRGVMRQKSTRLQESFDTVDIPRRGTTFQKNDTLYLCPNDMDTTTTNDLQKSQFQFEDAPITISDVSTFFAAHKQLPTEKEIPASYSPNSSEALSNLNLNQYQDQPKSSDSEDTTYNMAKFRKKYVELTCDSVVLSDLVHDDIEKTHLSLVNTLDDASEMVPHYECPSVIPDEVVVPSAEPLKPIQSVCRKCRRHRLSEAQNETTLGSFMLEPLPIYKMNLTALQELEKKPKISDIGNIWRQKVRESDSFNVSEGSYCAGLDESDTIEDFVRSLDSQRSAFAQQRKRIEIETRTSFINTVWTKMQSIKSNWILNELLLTNNVLKFTHKRLRTFAIIISTSPKDPRGIEVNIDHIQLIPNKLHTSEWKPLEYVLQYQLLVELPFDLRKICPYSERLFELLDHIENVTQDVLKTGKDMMNLVLSSPATLIREPSGGVYIRKHTRTKNLQNETKQTEIHIEVRNMKKLSYESIAMPPLYEFDEKIQSLPVGLDFLKIFLANPSHFLKP